MLPAQFVEQRLGVLQVGGVEALGDPVVDFGERRAFILPNWPDAVVASSAKA